MTTAVPVVHEISSWNPLKWMINDLMGTVLFFSIWLMVICLFQYLLHLIPDFCSVELISALFSSSALNVYAILRWNTSGFVQIINCS